MAFPTEKQWQLYRAYILNRPDAFKYAFNLVSKKYGNDFASALMNFIRQDPYTPSEDSFADDTYHNRPEVFRDAWIERIDLKGRPIGDQVDVTTDAVRDLWEQFMTTLDRDTWPKVAAATYVQISRDELEKWLDKLPLQGKWKVKKGYAGIYLLPLSDTVGVKLSSTIGSKDDAMGRGRASMQLALVSLVTGHVLNKKAQGQSHFKRTTNWKDTWRKGFDRIKQAYLKAQGFYDAIAVIEDREKYKKDLLKVIETVPGWESHRILADFHVRLEKGGILTAKQVGLLKSEVARSIKESPVPSVTPDEPTGSPIDDSLLERVRNLWRVAQRTQNNWLMSFAQSIGEQIKAGRRLTPRQEEVLDQNLRKYRLARQLIAARNSRDAKMKAFLKVLHDELARTLGDELAEDFTESVELSIEEFFMNHIENSFKRILKNKGFKSLKGKGKNSQQSSYEVDDEFDESIWCSAEVKFPREVIGRLGIKFDLNRLVSMFVRGDFGRHSKVVAESLLSPKVSKALLAFIENSSKELPSYFRMSPLSEQIEEFVYENLDTDEDCDDDGISMAAEPRYSVSVREGKLKSTFKSPFTIVMEMPFYISVEILWPGYYKYDSFS